MVMFKARFQPERPRAQAEPQEKPARTRLQQQQQQSQPQKAPQPQQTPPPIEKERGPQHPVREPGPGNPPERVRAARG